MTTISVTLPGHSYEIHVGPGLLAQLPALLPAMAPAARYGLITDDRVGALYGAQLRDRLIQAGMDTVLLTFPEGERHKTRQTWSQLTDALGEHGLGRDGAIIGLGGGVTGDLAGFVAATYRRGIPCVQVPTSLLAMIDAAIGGKTGVDTPHGKNLVGAFHQPATVVADTALLETLEDRHFRAGLAEALKHGVIADAEYFRTIVENSEQVLRRDGATLHALVTRSMEIKAEIVSDDPRERGRRAVLNFGHTFGHAIEAAGGYRLLHGEAVAAGMLLEARLAEELGLATDLSPEIRTALDRLGLPVTAPLADAGKYLRHDKKNRAGSVRFSLPKGLGQMVGDTASGWTQTVSESTIKQFLDTVC